MKMKRGGNKMKHKIDAFFLAFLIAMLAPIEGAYGLQFSATGGGAGGSGSVSMNIRAEDSASVNGQVSIDKAIVAPTTRLIGATALFEETHSVKDSTGKSASVYVKVANAPNGLTYSSQVLPGEGYVAAQPSVSAEQWLTVPKADSIVTKACSSYGTLSSDVGLEETKGSSTGDFVTLNGYDGLASASASSVSASQIAASGSANSIKIYGDAKDSSGSYSINTPLTGISGGKATFNTYALNDQSSAGTITQVTQIEYVNGGFTSKLTAGTKTQTRTSNYGTDYDLNEIAGKSASGPYVSGVLGYHVSPTTSANKIQSAVNAAQSGDWINVAAGTYKENVKIDKSLTVNGFEGAAKTIVDGQLKGSTFTIGQNNPNIDMTLSGMTIQNGKATYGGGILNEGRLAIKDSTISGNTATSGGGIYGTGTMTMDRDTVTGNTATFQAGGIYNYGTLTLNSGTSIINNIADNNSYSAGGGIYSYYGTVILNSGASVINNKASHIDVDNLNGEFVGSFGGGISSDNSMVTMNPGSTISGNTASFGGGGIYNDGGSKLTVNGGTISGNSAVIGGGILDYGTFGGVVNTDSNTVSIKDGTISGNTAESGAGIYCDIDNKELITGGTIINNVASSSGGGVYVDEGSLFTMSGGVITGNSADYGGGGILLSSSGAVLNSGSSITNNRAAYGGGLYLLNQGTVTLNTGTSVTHNTANSGGGILIDGGTVNGATSTVTGNTPNNIVRWW